MKKLIFLSILQLFFLTNLSAQQTNDLRGVRYYYSTPTFGDFYTFSSFKPLQIEETSGDYILGGWINSGLYQMHTLVSINQENSLINWDYIENYESQNTDFSIFPDGRVLDVYKLLHYPGQDDSIRTVLFSTNGTFEKKYFTPDTSKDNGILSVSRINDNQFLTNGSKFNHSSSVAYTSPRGYANIYHVDSVGIISDSTILPVENAFSNLPVEFSVAYESFSYKGDYLTFGVFQRICSTTTPNLIGKCPVLWHWNSDTVILTREIYADFSGNNSEISSDALLEVDGQNNEFVIAVKRLEDGDALPPTISGKVNFISFIDSNLNVVWDKKIGSLPSPYYYTLEDLKYDAESGFIYVCGFVESEIDPWYGSSFLAKYRRNGTLVFIKHFTLTQSNSSINSMNILDNGDLIFAGRGRDTLLDSFFFTYRTGPDGYHEDGAYLGLEEVLVSPTEIGIFPNPSDGIFQVSSISTEPMQITVLDQQGKQVAQFDLNELSSDNSFDLSDQHPGVYFAHISQGEMHWVKKLVVR